MQHTITFAFLFITVALMAQENGNNPVSRTAKATEFAIPSSPAFNMLNENTPSRIERFTSLRDFKVDWSLTNGQQGYTLSPGIAIEAQPIWLLFFDRAGAAKYRSATPLTRAFSTLSLSLGTSAANDKNWLAWGAKLNLYRQHDPLNDEAFLRALEAGTEDSKDSLLLQIKALEMAQIRLSRRDAHYDQAHQALSDSILQVELAIQELERAQTATLADVRDQYIQQHWNSSYLDLAFGRLLTYASVQDTVFALVENPVTPGQTDTVPLGNNTLRLAKQGYGVWMSGGLGLGANSLISGMVRYGKKPSRLTGTVGDTWSAGINLRYGTRRYNFFVEAFYDHFRDPLPQSAESHVVQKIYMLTFGGDWRISRNVVLSFGIRQNRDFDNGTFLLQPLINVNCLMR